MPASMLTSWSFPRLHHDLLRVCSTTRCVTRHPARQGTRASASPDASSPAAKVADGDWRAKARPIQPGSSYPAKEFCSNCGLCDTYYVAHVKDACAFLGDGAERWDQARVGVHAGKAASGMSVGCKGCNIVTSSMYVTYSSAQG